jgi:hypothetical protein
VFADARVLSNARARALGQSAQLRAMFPIDPEAVVKQIWAMFPAQNAGCVQSIGGGERVAHAHRCPALPAIGVLCRPSAATPLLLQNLSPLDEERR